MADENMRWRKSSYSGSGGNGGGECVEAAFVADDRLAMRDSKNPGAGTVIVTRAWISSVKAGRFDG